MATALGSGVKVRREYPTELMIDAKFSAKGMPAVQRSAPEEGRAFNPVAVKGVYR
jgi:hypothetical protein